MVFRWRADDGWLCSFVIFQGIRTSIAKKPFIFCDFIGVGGRPPVPPLDRPCMGWSVNVVLPGLKTNLYFGCINVYKPFGIS